MNDDEVIRVARLIRAVDNGEDPAELERLLAMMDASDRSVLWLAAKLIEGKPCCVATDNAESWRRARSMAERLGGVVSEEADGRMTSLRFDPPVRH